MEQGAAVQAAAPPAPPTVPAESPGDWIRKNLFSSVGNSIVTVLFVLIGYAALRWLVGLVLDEERNWAAVWTNMRLLFSYTYPADQYIRIWVSLGLTLLMVGLTLGAFASQVRLSLGGLLTRIGAAGLALLVLAIVHMVDLFGLTFHSPERPVVVMLVVGAILAAIGFGGRQAVGAGSDDERTVPLFAVVAGGALAFVLFLWLVPFGRYEAIGGDVIAEPGTVNFTTKFPWTIMMALLVGGYLAGLAARAITGSTAFRLFLGLWWVAGPAFLVFLVLRDPEFDWAHIWSTDLPMALGFAIGGGALLYFLSAPGRGEVARIAGAVLLLYAAFNWLAAFGDLNLPGLGTINWQWYPFASPPAGVEGTSMLQKARISFLLLALVALIAPNFAGELRTRLRFVGAWAGFMLLMHWLITGINTPSTVQVVQPPFLGGFALTLVIAYYVMLASFPVGMMMALARTSKMPIFRVLATGYIEFVRGVPLITVLFFFANIVNLFLPNGMELSDLGAIFLGYTLFSGAYMAENIRGGLQSIRRGQFEASDALGLTTVQRTAFIVMPQALRVSIPNLVGQAIATFKETSLIAIIGGFDFLRVANQSVPSQPGFLGQNLPALLFISVIYWIISYAMSRGSRSLETRLGVGTR